MREGRVPSNVSPEEFFNFYCTDERAVEYYDKIVGVGDEHAREIAYLEGRVSSISEQLFYAQELISEIECLLDRETRLSEFKKTFKRMLAESSFEI